MATSSTAKPKPPIDVTNWTAWREGDDEYRGKVVEMTQWLNSLDFGAVIVYDGITYHKPVSKFHSWYEEGWTVGCSVEHTVFPEWFSRAADGDQSKIEVTNVGSPQSVDRPADRDDGD
jgi:hypothetical protein